MVLHAQPMTSRAWRYALVTDVGAQYLLQPLASYSLDSRSTISGTTASSAKWIDSTEFVE